MRIEYFYFSQSEASSTPVVSLFYHILLLFEFDQSTVVLQAAGKYLQLVNKLAKCYNSHFRTNNVFLSSDRVSLIFSHILTDVAVFFP